LYWVTNEHFIKSIIRLVTHYAGGRFYADNPDAYNFTRLLSSDDKHHFDAGLLMLFVLPVELDLLRLMRPLDREVFNYLAERMDYESGVIGRSRQVSYGGMALDLSERDVARRVKESLIKVTSCQVRESVRRLIAEGLLVSLSSSSDSRQLIVCRAFYQKILPAHQSAQNPVPAESPQQLHVLFKALSLNNNNLQDKKQSSPQIRSDSVPITSIYSINNNARETDFVMTLDWQYAENEMQMILHRAGGFTVDKIKPEWVSGFVGYWWGQGDKKRLNQQQWTAKLGANIVNYLRNPGTFESLQGASVKAAGAAAESVHYPDWARLPRDDQQLVSWMRRMGYGDPPPGVDFKQARAFVQRKVDVRLGEWKRGLS